MIILKFHLKLFLFFSLSLSLTADNARKVVEADLLPENGFTDYVSLQSWAKRSSFGGGKSGVLRVKGTS